MFPGPYLPGPYYYPYSYSYPYPYAYPYASAADYHYQLLQYQLFQPVAPRREQGGLVLEALPDTAQVYVDDFYVGVVADFGPRGRALDLPAGAHRIELRAPAYELLSFSVIITPNEIVRFRGDMRALPAAATSPQAAPPRAAHKNVYVIPNCYAGDKPPTGSLPSGCDRKKLQTRK